MLWNYRKEKKLTIQTASFTCNTLLYVPFHYLKNMQKTNVSGNNVLCINKQITEIRKKKIYVQYFIQSMLSRNWDRRIVVKQ